MNYNEMNPLVREGGAYDRLAVLFDKGSFVETGAYVKGTEPAGVVCGYGAVDGALTFAFAQDFTRNKGAVGKTEADKIVNLYAMAKKSGAPVIGVFESAGAKISEGTGALSAFGKIIDAVSGASGIIPQIAVINGTCAGMSAVAASMFDIIIASENASCFVNPPFITRDASDKCVGTIGSASEHGIIDIVCDSPESALNKARELAAYLPQNNAQGLAYAEASDDSGRLTPELKDAADTKTIIDALIDEGSFIGLKTSCAPEMITGLCSLGTVTTGIVATKENTCLTPAAARKAASFISFCDSFMIPVLTLVDTKGLMPTAEAEKAPYSTELARLGQAYASSGNAKVTLVTGSAYGAAFTLLGSKALGADIAYALPKAVISVMEPEAAVQFLYGETIKASAKPVEERAALTEKWMTENASAKAAAELGDIDDILPYEICRAKLISAFIMLWSKADGEVQKKHTKLPF